MPETIYIFSTDSSFIGPDGRAYYGVICNKYIKTWNTYKIEGKYKLELNREKVISVLTSHKAPETYSGLFVNYK